MFVVDTMNKHVVTNCFQHFQDITVLKQKKFTIVMMADTFKLLIV